LSGDHRHEARTFSSDGSRGYDVMGMTQEQIIADGLGRYTRYHSLVQSQGSALVASAPEHV